MEVLGKWKDYKVFWMNKDYTRNLEDISEVLRVKFYRAKDIYKKLEDNFVGNKECDDCIYNFVEGYCIGVRADKDTRDILLWLIRKNYFKEI